MAGLAKGRKIESPKGIDVRPTTDRVREALFSAIAFRVKDARVLDLFAGTGALGLEALSRRARSAVFVDRDRRSIELIKRNIELCHFADRAVVFTLDALKATDRLKSGEKFDLIFLDPPYNGPFLEQSVAALGEAGLLAEGGLVIAEHPAGHPPTLPAGLSVATTKRYGKTVLSFVQHTLDIEEAEHSKEAT